jgi:hypothetical protein
MVDDTSYSDERIRSEASDTMRGGGDIRERVRSITLAALKERRFDSAGMREVVRAVSEGIATGAERRSTHEMRNAFADALSGLDAALRTSAEAGYAALKQMSATGRTFSDTELRQALSSMRRIEEDFLGTVGQVADSASAQVRPPLREALEQTRRAGTATGKQVALTMAEFTQRFSLASIDATVTGLEVAGEMGARFAALASGILTGVSEALRPAPRPAPVPPSPPSAPPESPAVIVPPEPGPRKE